MPLSGQNLLTKTPKPYIMVSYKETEFDSVKPEPDSPDSPGARYRVVALERGLEILALFTSDHPTLSLTEIVTALHLNKSTAFRMLSTLEAAGYLERDPLTLRYRPGLKILRLGFATLNSMEVRHVARPYLEKLAAEVNETSSLSVLDDLDIVYVDRIRNRAIVGVVLEIGSRLQAHCTSMGKVLLADLAPEELAARLDRGSLTQYTDRTIVDRAALLDELAAVRRRGYAVNDEELALGLRTVAAAIRDNSRRALAAVNISGPTTTISPERLQDVILPAVVQCAENISLALGYSPGT
jgi:IclR family pca regulon transcriptional regulator